MKEPKYVKLVSLYYTYKWILISKEKVKGDSLNELLDILDATLAFMSTSFGEVSSIVVGNKDVGFLTGDPIVALDKQTNNKFSQTAPIELLDRLRDKFYGVE